MKIIIQGDNVTIDTEVRDIIFNKLSELEKFIHSDDESAQLEVTLEKVTTKKDKGDIFEVEAKLHTSSGDFFSEETSEEFIASLDGIKDDLKRQLTEKKDKNINLERRGSRDVKDMIKSEEE